MPDMGGSEARQPTARRGRADQATADQPPRCRDRSRGLHVERLREGGGARTKDAARGGEGVTWPAAAEHLPAPVEAVGARRPTGTAAATPGPRTGGWRGGACAARPGPCWACAGHGCTPGGWRRTAGGSTRTPASRTAASARPGAPTSRGMRRGPGGLHTWARPTVEARHGAAATRTTWGAPGGSAARRQGGPRCARGDGGQAHGRSHRSRPAAGAAVDGIRA